MEQVGAVVGPDGPVDVLQVDRQVDADQSEPSGETMLTDAPPPGSGELKTMRSSPAPGCSGRSGLRAGDDRQAGGEGRGAERVATVVVHGASSACACAQQPSRLHVPLAMPISWGLRGCETASMGGDLAAARSELTKVVGQPLDAAEFSHEISVALMKVLPFDGWCLVGMDPDTGLRTAHFSGRGTEQTAEMARNEALMRDVNRFRDLAVAPTPAGWLSRDHPAAKRSFRLNEILLPQGFESEIRLVLRDGTRLWGALTLFRDSGHRQFDDADIATVCGIASR